MRLGGKDKRRSRRRVWPKLLGGLAVLGLLFVGIGLGIYYWATLPVDPGNSREVRLIVEPGETVDQIAVKLERAELVRSKLVFRIYTELTGKKSKLQAGGYALSRSMSVSQIADHISSGKTDEFNVTILPGQTIREISVALVRDGFGQTDVDAALSKNYDHPLLIDKPASHDLEGYLFPETYKVSVTGSAEDLVVRALDEFYVRLQEEDLASAWRSHGLNIHQGITLASIVQKEVTNATDQAQVAQVFLKRLSVPMQLGSDVTFIYAAKKMGVEPSVNIDSPYNTRRYDGLPPGPIANPSLTSLRSVAHPAAGDYLYFVAGEDGVTHYARTIGEHESNVAKYCGEACR